MKAFITRLVEDNAVGDWLDIYAEAAKHRVGKITVEAYDETAEISDQQRKWLHCKDGPIREQMREGWSFRDAKEYIKVEYGRQWFVVDLADDNFREIDGIFRWECRKPLCRKLIHPASVIVSAYGYERQCPYCGNVELKKIAIKSIMSVSVKNTNLWFNEIFAHMPKILPPDPEWSKKKEKNTE